MHRLIKVGITLALFAHVTAQAAESLAPLTPDWSENAMIDPYGRANPYGWDQVTLAQKVRAGLHHALNYPVTPTGLLLPEKTAYEFMNAKPGDPLFALMKTLLSFNPDFKNFKGIWDWMGLHDYPANETEIPYPKAGIRPDYPMGVTIMERNHTSGITFSCAVCHSAELFGKPILGLTNRFPNANSIFVLGQKFLHDVPPSILTIMTDSNRADVELYKIDRKNIRSVGTKKPVTLGLDTALSQVALSLARRAHTPWAEKDTQAEDHPRPDLLDTKVADSKPAVWWNVKYKTKWLSDGAVVSGNPILTNIIWNELGRGSDLKVLDRWISENATIFEELATAVFATKAPRWEDYLGENTLNLTRAKRGEMLFAQNCAHCHGQYEKAWSLSNLEFSKKKSADPTLSLSTTLRARYFAQTPVVNVGTDPGRKDGMVSIADALNPLEISHEHGIKNVVQDGYVPPPLEGIFSRYPYLHNNSVPNLCALMTKPANRPKNYISGAPMNKYTDYDQQCVGYPIGNKTPKAWIKAKDAKVHWFYTKTEGLSNSGHYEGIFTTSSGAERYTIEEKFDLIEFLKTL